MDCSFCSEPMEYLHGHASCLNRDCPMYGVNQAPCCDGETAGEGRRPTPEIAARRPA